MSRPVAILLLLAFHGLGVAMADGQTMGQERLQRLYEANDLGIEGHVPFRLHMSFQLYDLEGKPSTEGTLEMHGPAKGNKHLVIHAPTLKEDGTPVDGSSVVGGRDAYLVAELVALALNPVSKPGPAPKAPQVESRQFGKVVLECVNPQPALPNHPQPGEDLYCTEATKDAVRYLSKMSGSEGVARNSIGLFHEVSVALNLDVLFEGRLAISGKVTTLQAIDPATLTPPADESSGTSPAPDSVSPSPRLRIAGGVIVGTRTRFVQPEYPLAAKVGRISGKVLLRVIIAKDGTIQRLVPIAVTDPVFTEAAIRAVSQWTYKPYQLNGEPTAVDTTITVNFQLRP